MALRTRVLDVILIAALVVYTAVLIIVFWKNPYFLAILLLLPPLLLGYRLGDPLRAALLASVCLILGPFTESMCVAFGLWTYHETGGLPWTPPWIFSLWACFGAALWIVVRSVLGRQPRPQVGAKQLLWLLPALGLEIVIFVKLGHSTPLALAAAVPLAIAVLLASRRLDAVVLFVTGSIIGPVCESAPIAYGAWHYATPEFLGMPAWLPLGYAIFATLVGLIAETVAALVLKPHQAPVSQRAQV